MYIDTGAEEFLPTNFVVLNFYGQDTYFVWNAQKLVVFPYTTEDVPPHIRHLKPPATISDIRCFSKRIFILCSPCGAYKLQSDYTFAFLSSSAIGFGSTFRQVLKSRKNQLYLANVEDRKSKAEPLLKLSSKTTGSDDLRVLAICANRTHETLKHVLWGGVEDDRGVCIVVNGRNVFKMIDTTVQLIYKSEYSIVNIVEIEKSEKTFGVALVTKWNIVILMHAKSHGLVFEEVSLSTTIRAICVGVYQDSVDTLWIVHSDGRKTYYTKKKLDTESMEKLGVENYKLTCLRRYGSKIVLGLTSDAHILELPVDFLEKEDLETSNFVPLKVEMLENTDEIVDKISERVEELQTLEGVLKERENELFRVNMFASKYTIRSSPETEVRRIADQSFLTVDFKNALPEKCQIVVALRTDGRKIFVAKEVRDLGTVVELSTPATSEMNSFDVTADLITLPRKDTAWCLVRNCCEDCSDEKASKVRPTSEQVNFINVKLTVLRNLMREGKLTFEKLSAIKKSVRDEIKIT